MKKLIFIGILFLSSRTLGTDTEPDSKLLVFPNFGVSIAAPEGWKETPPDKYHLLVQWISPDSKPGQFRGAITVDGRKATEADAETTARALAKFWGESVADEKTSLDGQVAYRILAPKDRPDLQPAEAILAIHDGYAYTIAGGAAPDRVGHDALEQVRKSWKWSGFESSAKHLEFRNEPFRVGDIATLEAPRLMHTNPVEHPELDLDLLLYDLPSHSWLMRAYVRVDTRAQGETFDAYKERALAGLRTQFNLPADFEWRAGKGGRPRVVTPLVKAPNVPARPPGTANWFIYALVDLDDKRVVFARFGVTTDSNEHHEYEEAAARMVDSITPIAKRVKRRVDNGL